MGRYMADMGRHAKRVVITAVGAVLVIAGLFMLVLPGPGLLAIVAGLAVLASEHDWAKGWLERARDKLKLARARRADPQREPVEEAPEERKAS